MSSHINRYIRIYLTSIFEHCKNHITHTQTGKQIPSQNTKTTPSVSPQQPPSSNLKTNKQTNKQTKTYPSFAFSPRIIVSGQSNTSITDTHLLGQTDLRHCRHVDDIAAPPTEHLALGPGREPRPLYGQHCPLLVTHEAQPLGHAHQNLTHLLAVRLVHRQVTHPLGTVRPAVVKRWLSLEGAVNELVGNDDVTRMYVFLEGAAGRCGNDVGASLDG